MCQDGWRMHGHEKFGNKMVVDEKKLMILIPMSCRLN
jgi:hypothetical protein